MEEIKVIIETEEEIKEEDKLFVEDAITDAIEKLGWKVIRVKVVW